MDVMTAGITETSEEVAVHGRFDAHLAPEVREWIDARLFDERFDLGVDLSDVTFIDSTALAVLVRGMKRSRLAGGDLVLRDPSETVRVILELTRLDAAFEIVVSAESSTAGDD
jgi:anti-sigma B factor antagonist